MYFYIEELQTADYICLNGIYAFSEHIVLMYNKTC